MNTIDMIGIMRNSGLKRFAFAALAAFGLLSLSGCPKSVKSITRLQHLETGVKNPTKIEELEDAIKKYQTRVVDVQTAVGQTGIWYKMLGTRYLEQKMYGKALECFRQAVEIYPDNQNLYYYIGVCAGYMSHTALDYSGTGSTAEKFNYLKVSEEAYQRAISIEPRYVRALYGLGVLYVHDLKQPEKAVPHLEALLEIDRGHTDAMFVLAHAYYATFDYDKAAQTYDRIIAGTKSQEKRDMAIANKKKVLDANYGK